MQSAATFSINVPLQTYAEDAYKQKLAKPTATAI
jgi:hypothetical protein